MSIKRFSVLILSLVMILSACLSCAYGEDIDTSEDQKKADEYGIPTIDFVKQLEESADSLWNEKNYTEAAPAYARLATQANWLANIIASIDEPFYSADSKEQDKFYNDTMMELAANAENHANSYKRIRNKAMAREGLCYYYLNDYQEAVPRLMKALNLIDINDTENWKQCADAIIEIVGLTTTLETEAAKKKEEEEARALAEEEAKKKEEELLARIEESKKEMEELYAMLAETEAAIAKADQRGEPTAELEAKLAEIKARIKKLTIEADELMRQY